jgi:tetratricopeptide (TPR) repeat protein
MRERAFNNPSPAGATQLARTGATLVLAAVLIALPRTAAAQTRAAQPSSQVTTMQLLQGAQALFAQGDYESALKYYLQVLPSFPKNFDILKNTAYCYFSEGRRGYAQAAQYYQRAFEVNPHSQEVGEKLALCLMGLKRPAEAASILRNMAETSGAPPEMWKSAAEAYSEAGNSRQAETAYDAFLQRRPGDLAARVKLADVYAISKDYTRALEQYRLALNSSPNYAPALVGMARVLSWQSQYEQSLDLYERVLRSNPSNGDARSGKAFVLLWMGRPAEAEPLFAELHRRFPSDSEVARGLEAAHAAVQQKSLAEARRSGNVVRLETYYREQLAKNPKDLEALRALVGYTSSPERCAESIGFARRALEIDPSDHAMELSLARVLAVCQQYAEAIVRFQRYLEARPQAQDVRFELGQAQLRLHRTADATETFRTLLKQNPGSLDAQLGLAQMLTTSGNYPEALLRFNEVLEKSPTNYDALQGKAFVLYWTKKYDESKAIFEKLAAERPSDAQNTQALKDIASAQEAAHWAALRPAAGAPPKDFAAFYRARLASYPDDLDALRGLAYNEAQMNQVPEAIRDYRSVLERAPDDQGAQMELARLLSLDHQYVPAIQLYRQVLEKHPDDQAAMDRLATVYLWNNQPAEALPVYKQLLAKNPSSLADRLQVARLELRTEDYPAARQALESVLQADPKNQEALLALAQLDLRQGHNQDALKNFNVLLQQDPQNTVALLARARLMYYQGDLKQAGTDASAVVAQNPKNFDAVLLLANIEHAQGHRGKSRQYVRQAEQISPGNPDAVGLEQRLRMESAVTVHTSASYTREIGPSSEATTGGIAFLPGRTVSGLPNEDLRMQTYTSTLGFSPAPHWSSSVSFASLPSQVPALPIRDAQGNQIPSPLTGAVAPYQFLFRQTWQVSKYLTLRGGAGMARYGPAAVVRSPFLDGNLNTISATFGSSTLEALGIYPQAVSTDEFKPLGMAGLTISSASNKVSLDLDWHQEPAIFYVTPYSIKRRLTERQYRGGLNFNFTSRTTLRLDFFYSQLYTDSEVGYSMPDPILVALPLSTPCASPTPVEVFAGASSHQCLGGQIIQTTGVRHDWGHGGDIVFTQGIVRRQHFSLDVGYRGTLYGYAGRTRGVFLGFFNPSFYQNQMLTGRIYGKLVGPIGYDIYGGMGLQQTNHGGAMTRSSTVSPAFSLKVSNHLTLGISYTHYNTAQILGPLRGNAVAFTTDWTLF